MAKTAKNKAKLARSKNKQWYNPKTEALCQAFLLLKDQGEVKNFLRDLLTGPEIVEFGNRFYAAQMLAKGVHYNAIAEDTGLSSRTIARVQHWRKEGMGGYRMVMSRLAR
jgi:TrpR-related protein YerC/YecD